MNKKQIIVFTISLLLIVIVCRYFDDYSGDTHSPNIAMYVWEVSPLLMTLIFRTYNKDWRGLDIRFHFVENWKWYVLALFGVPIVYALKILISQLAGNVEVTENFSIPLIAHSVLGGFGLVFLKNYKPYFKRKQFPIGFSLNQN